MTHTVYKKIITAAAVLLLAFVLCSCGRNDISLKINKDGSIDAQIVYGIDKSMVAGDDVLNQVKNLIKQPLDENNVKYEEKDEEDFSRIIVDKHFESAAALADETNWQGIPFVPKFTAVPTVNAITVTAKDGKITFDGTLTSDSFGATELLSDNKKAFGASIAITANKESGNGKSSGKNTMKWEGTAEDSVKLELTASYKGEDFTEKDAPAAESEAGASAAQGEDGGKTNSAEKSAAAKAERASGAADRNYTVPIVFAAMAAAAAASILLRRKNGTPKKELSEIGDNTEEEKE